MTRRLYCAFTDTISGTHIDLNDDVAGRLIRLDIRGTAAESQVETKRSLAVSEAMDGLGMLSVTRWLSKFGDTVRDGVGRLWHFGALAIVFDVDHPNAERLVRMLCLHPSGFTFAPLVDADSEGDLIAVPRQFWRDSPTRPKYSFVNVRGPAGLGEASLDKDYPLDSDVTIGPGPVSDTLGTWYRMGSVLTPYTFDTTMRATPPDVTYAMIRATAVSSAGDTVLGLWRGTNDGMWYGGEGYVSDSVAISNPAAGPKSVPRVRLGVVSAVVGNAPHTSDLHREVFGASFSIENPREPHLPLELTAEVAWTDMCWHELDNPWEDYGVDHVFIRAVEVRESDMRLEYLVIGSAAVMNEWFFNRKTHYPELFIVAPHKGESVLVPAQMYDRRSFWSTVNPSTGPAIVRHSWDGSARAAAKGEHTVAITTYLGPRYVERPACVFGAHFDRPITSDLYWSLNPGQPLSEGQAMSLTGSCINKVRKAWRGVLRNTSGPVSKFYIPDAAGKGVPPIAWDDSNVISDSASGEIWIASSTNDAAPPQGGTTMPWLSIIMALLTFFLSGGAEKKNRTKALALAAFAGLGTYYVTHETDWGKANLGDFDGVPTPGDGSTDATDEDGKPVNIGGGTVKPPAIATPGGTRPTGIWDTIRGWGVGGAAVIAGGVGAVASGNGTAILVLGIAALALLS